MKNPENALRPGRWFLHSAFCILHSLPRSILLALVKVYRVTVSPAQTFVFGPSAGCRFTPTCSAYAVEALQTRGAAAGSWLTVKRLCRCHPWGGCGHDPVPPANLKSQISNLKFSHHGS